MSRITRTALLMLAAGIGLIQWSIGQPVRIMPMGNSITFDDNANDVTNPRPVGDRISYRYRLYQLLKAAHYDFDYVGSENAGINYFQDPECDDNAGFPGINKSQLAYLLETGYNLRTSHQVTSGPYLQFYQPDIILLHIGTNDLSTDASPLGDILDNIKTYAPNAIVLVARIINRSVYSSETTTFNDNVQALVTARHDPKIISVNMETGAGINYSTDMNDLLHPNVTGYNKMAAKWFQELDKLNEAPVIADIPEQLTFEDTSFPLVDLYEYVHDKEDSIQNIKWTLKLQNQSHLSGSVETGHILKVVPVTANWYGSENIRLYATDRGNGAFPKTDSIDVPFTVTPANDAPAITSTPPDTAVQDQLYTYHVTANDIDTGDVVMLYVTQKPEWLTFDQFSDLLSGIPSNANVGVNYVTIRASDGKVYTDQSFILDVKNVNDPPVFTSIPVTEVQVNQAYLYLVTVTDPDKGDIVTFEPAQIPSWLEFIPGISNAYLVNTPTIQDTGSYQIELKATDGKVETIQDFILTVSHFSSVIQPGGHADFRLYPNPAHDNMMVVFDHDGYGSVELYDLAGEFKHQWTSAGDGTIEAEISELPAGIYIYKISHNGKIYFGKISKY